MTREQFGNEFVRAMRFVIQKHDRANDAMRRLSEMGSSPSSEDAYVHAQNNLDAALIQLGDHLYDAIEGSAVPLVQDHAHAAH